MSSTSDGLWDIQLNKNKKLKYSSVTPKILISKVNYFIQKNKTTTDLAQYNHAAAFSPPCSTFQKVIRNSNFVTWLGIAHLNFPFPTIIHKTIASEKGHVDEECRNLQYIKLDTIQYTTLPMNELETGQDTSTSISHHIFSQ